MTARIVDVRQGVLSKNDALAAELRQHFREPGVTVLNLVSSPGAGKTALLERTLADLLARCRRAAALVGDLATENDARRLPQRRAGAQIVTAGICHLEAEMVAAHLAGWDLRTSTSSSSKTSATWFVPPAMTWARMRASCCCPPPRAKTSRSNTAHVPFRHLAVSPRSTWPKR